ncbi:MAG: S49 family peptidase [Pseudomonadota bacterium]
MIARPALPFLRPKSPRVSVLRLQGIIAATGGRGTLSHAVLAPAIERAFRKGKPAAVALAINSPGGSPVQSALIGAHIRRLADELDRPVHAFVEDVAASGGYWLAAAADEIWLDASSITGSIGVISAGFGFPAALEKLGVERRVHTAGQDKSMLDPFRPERPEDVARLKALQSRIHAHFIDHVKSRRGDRLSAERDDLFTGEIFVGADAVTAGLADGLAHLAPKMRELYGEKVRFIGATPRRPLLQRLIPSVASEAFDALEARAHWARFGL